MYLDLVYLDCPQMDLVNCPENDLFGDDFSLDRFDDHYNFYIVYVDQRGFTAVCMVTQLP